VVLLSVVEEERGRELEVVLEDREVLPHFLVFEAVCLKLVGERLLEDQREAVLVQLEGLAG